VERIAAALERADDLADLLDAAWDAFEAIISATGTYADTSEGFSTAMVYALTAAAEGRDAIIMAPSLPGRTAGEQPPRSWKLAPGNRPGEAAAAMAALSAVLAVSLAAAASQAADPVDRAACLTGARHAREIGALLAGTLP
jgi:hypothetical protein